MRRPSPAAKTRRAAAQFAWTEPLRPVHKRYRRLAAAAFRLGGLSLGGTVLVAVARARNGLHALDLALLAALVLVGAVALLLGRAAAREARKVEAEIARIEEEAWRQLP